VDVVMLETTFNVLTFRVENAAGAALLILDTVRVDTESVLDAIVLAERVLAERLDPLSVE